MAKIPKRQSESVYQRRTDNTMDKRYQRGNQNLYIKEEQSTQWSKDTKGAIRICISKKNRQHNGQKTPKGQSESVYQRRTDNTMVKRYQRGNQNLYIKEEQTTQWTKDTKGVIRICISKKNSQHNGQKIPKGQSESVYQRRTDNTMDKRHQRGNQNLYIKEEQTTQWSKDTKGVIRICISKNRQHNGQKIPKV
jgi:phage FluMu protein Com